MRLSMIWRVMKIEISIILQIVRKPNPITVSFVIDFQFKKKVKHAYLDRCMLTLIDVKFTCLFLCKFGEKRMISSADILQIVNIFCRVVRVFLLFLVVVRLFRLQFKTCEIIRHSCTALPKQRQPRLQGFWVAVHYSHIYAILILMSFSIHRKTSSKFGQR